MPKDTSRPNNRLGLNKNSFLNRKKEAPELLPTQKFSKVDNLSYILLDSTNRIISFNVEDVIYGSINKILYKHINISVDSKSKILTLTVTVPEEIDAVKQQVRELGPEISKIANDNHHFQLYLSRIDALKRRYIDFVKTNLGVAIDSHKQSKGSGPDYSGSLAF